VLPKAPKILNTKGHVEVDANINNVVANKPASLHKIRDCGFFYDYKI